MEIAFEAIGLDVTNETAFNNLAADAGKLGEASQVARKSGGVLHGRCWRLGEGLEVWTVLYESETGEVFQTDCRPAFRARYAQRVNPWLLTEFDEEGEALIHGFIEDKDTEILFELQNLTEVEAKNLQEETLLVGLCGLAYRAEATKKAEKPFWKSLGERDGKNENDWSLGGEVLEFKSLSNPYSGNDLFWVYLNVGEFNLEVLVNQRALRGREVAIGGFLKAEVWLQGHISKKVAGSRRFAYEGVDYSVHPSDFWKKFKRLN